MLLTVSKVYSPGFIPFFLIHVTFNPSGLSWNFNYYINNKESSFPGIYSGDHSWFL